MYPDEVSWSEEDFLQLSGIQHFKFCRRQWALIHIENQWADNFRTVDGELMHAMYQRGYTPKVKPSKSCNVCSLKELCLPKLMQTGLVCDYLRNAMGIEG